MIDISYLTDKIKRNITSTVWTYAYKPIYNEFHSKLFNINLSLFMAIDPFMPRVLLKEPWQSEVPGQ